MGIIFMDNMAALYFFMSKMIEEGVDEKLVFECYNRIYDEWKNVKEESLNNV